MQDRLLVTGKGVGAGQCLWANEFEIGNIFIVITEILKSFTIEYFGKLFLHLKMLFFTKHCSLLFVIREIWQSIIN